MRENASAMMTPAQRCRCHALKKPGERSTGADLPAQ